MYSKKSKVKKGIILFVCLILVFLLLFYSFNLNRNYTTVERWLKDGTAYIQKIAMYPFAGLNNEKEMIATDSYLIQKNVNVALEKEIEYLRNKLLLNETLTFFEPVNATVLNRNRGYWFNTLTIDKGKSDGIKEDMAVVTSHGLIGKVSKVSNHSSEVKLLTSDDIQFRVSVSITTKNKDTHAILNGYDQKRRRLKLVDVDSHSEIEKGDIITTSGIGGRFPRGIYIGVVDDINIDRYGISKTVYVTSSQDFNNIHYVSVLTRNSK